MALLSVLWSSEIEDAARLASFSGFTITELEVEAEWANPYSATCRLTSLSSKCTLLRQSEHGHGMKFPVRCLF